MKMINIRKYLSVNTLILIISGLVLMAWGAWTVYRFRSYMYGGGIFLVGVGNFMFGITNGFADTTPWGRFYFKIGALSYLVGISSVLYTMRYIFY